jgi:hypothetical protein
MTGHECVTPARMNLTAVPKSMSPLSPPPLLLLLLLLLQVCCCVPGEGVAASSVPGCTAAASGYTPGTATAAPAGLMIYVAMSWIFGFP